MEDKVYIVTLYKHEDLEQFYNEMSDYHLVMKRPMSRNTHYKMTEEQAEKLRQDPRVWDVQLPPKERGLVMGRDAINYNEYNIPSENFWKADTSGPATVNATDRQWGHVHCAGVDSVTRGKGAFGEISGGGTYEQKVDSVDIFNDGKHVDVVICDDPVSIDCEEWFSPTSNTSRFKQYDWYTELNTLVGTIDDDGQTLPSAPYPNYFDNATNTESHGTHVAGTVAGQHYGWAREANIYSMQVLSNVANTGTPVPDLLIFDYLRAFHRNKAVNPLTGIKNPTITNHSWSYGVPFDDILEKANFDLTDFQSVIYRGTTYDQNNPNPSGWTWAGLEADFGFAPNKMRLNTTNAATNADVEDAISEGVVIVAAAGNNNFHCVSDGDPDYYNHVKISGITVYYNQGSSPGNSNNAICVGSVGTHHDFRRSTFSNFGPNIDVFAPGSSILSAYDSSGIADTKYGGAPNYFYPISGTSMASPQVAGVLACLSTGKERFTQSVAKKYLKDHSIYGDMTFDANGGLFDDNSCSKDSPNVYLHAKNPRAGVTGMISEQLGNRTNGLTFPRVSTFNRQAPAPAGGGGGGGGAGQQAFTTPGSYNWECPVGVTSVSVVCVGAGGTGGAYGGSGGSLAYKNNITVTPGTTYSIAVGNTNSQIYESPYSFDAENSSAFDCVAFGGIGGYSSGTAESTFKAIGTGYDGGGRGGLASGDKSVDGVYKEGAGGGAGGYSGDGGNAGKGNCDGSSGNRAPTAGSGGGGGGGTPTNVAGSNGTAGGGGGVGLLGEGASGAAGTYGALGTQFGGGGSGGADGTDPYGGQYGGGSGGQPGTPTPNMNAQHGAVRIIWPGDERQFPSTRTADE